MVSAAIRQSLFGALHPDSGDDSTFLTLIKESSLPELFQELPQKDRATLWNLVLSRLHRLVSEERYCTPNASKSQDLAVMEACCSLAKCYVDGNFAKSDCPKALVGVAQLLHGVLFTLQPEDSSKLANSISQLCEAWWKQGLLDKNTLVPQTISYLLVRSIEQSGTKADVSRVNQMRESLLLLDFDDESGDPLKHLLLRCMISPLYLRSAEGRKFLSFTFTLHLPFIDQIFLTMKNQLPMSSNSIVDHYGEVLFRAWRMSQGQFLLKLEQTCLQHLIHCGIHALDPKTAKTVRSVLHQFHENKKLKGVDEMLYRLYGPILWRCLNVANPIVRRNAAALFIEAFPVQNPAEGVENTDQFLTKQFQYLRDLLEDGDPVVRAVVAGGVGRVLGLYWELIPAPTIKVFVDALLERAAFDAAAFAVRVAVLNGVAFVLENFLSHALLKMKLPSLRPLIYDPSPRVQVAFLELLLLIKKTRSMRFTDIVPIETLLKRLETCAPQVSDKITALLMPYFPQNKPLAEQVKRGWALIRKHPHHGQLFFNHVHKHAPVEAILNLISGFHQFLLTAGGAKETAQTSKASKKARGEPVHSVLWQQDQPAVEALLCTMAQLWSNVRREAPKNSEAFSKLIRHFEADVGDIQALLGYFPSEIATTAILTMATFLPKQKTADLLPKLQGLPEAAPLSQYAPPIECLFSWGRGADVVALVATGLSQEGDTTIDHETAVKFLNYIVESQRLRAWLLANISTGAAELMELLARSQQLPMSPENFAAFELYGKLQLHLYAQQPEEPPPGLESMLNLMDLLSDNFSSVPQETSEQPVATSKRRRAAKASSVPSSVEVNTELIVYLMKFSTELVTLGLDARQFTDRVLRWVTLLNERPSQGLPVSSSFLLSILPVLYKLLFQWHLSDCVARRDLDPCFRFASQLLDLSESSLADSECAGALRTALVEILRTAKERKSNLISTVGFFVSTLLAEKKETTPRARDRVIVPVLVRVPDAMFCLPQVLEKLAPPSEPSTEFAPWVQSVLESLQEFGREAKLEISTIKGRADFVHCMRVCAKTLHLLQGETADLHRGCLATAAQQQTSKRTSLASLDDGEFADQIDEALQESS